MARKNKAKKSQPLRDRTALASRRVSNSRSYSPNRPVGPVLALQVRRVAEPSLRASVKRKAATKTYVDVKTSLRPLASSPLPTISKPKIASPRAKVAMVKKQVRIQQTPRQHSRLSLAPNTPEPDARKSSERARDLRVCKKRPDSKKAARSGGSGGYIKRFVPWC